MLDFLRLGGVGSPIVLFLSLVAVAAAAMFAARPDERKLPVIRALQKAVLYTVAFASFSGMHAVCRYAAGHRDGDVLEFIVSGIGEVLTLGMLGFPMLAASWLLVAIGHRRLGAQG